MGKLLDEIIYLLAPPADFTIEIKSQMPISTAQKLALNQVFYHLISHAIKHHSHNYGYINIWASDKEKFY